MSPIGQRTAWLIAGALVAGLPALFMWGFTVDDALISVRYTRHLVEGVGWRFDVGGAVTDGVTPLPWPLVLAPMAATDALGVLWRAKALGLLAWIAAGAGLGGAMGRRAEEDAAREGGRTGIRARVLVARATALLALALSVPVAAHAVSGMETAIATALATFAVLAGRSPWKAATLAGLAAAFRPELAPWACVLAAGVSIVGRRGVGRSVGAAAVALVPFAACVIVRLVVWGRPSPLALMAKPSDLDHGLAYAGAAVVVTLVPLLVLAPIALRRCPEAAVVALAAVAHVLALVAVGGDWMPYARLMVPVVPSLAWAAALVAEHASPLASGVRGVAAVALGVVLVARGGAEGRLVGPDRAALVKAARPALEGAAHVASLDVGWVGAATEGDVVDLAGVTDPAIAALPGGHTSKRVDARLLLDRGVDAVLLYLPVGLPGGDTARWREARYGRVVEARLAADDVLARHFVAAKWLPLGARGAGYVLLRAEPGE